MIFIRRDRPASARMIGLRVGLFFLAAGLWLAGVVVENDAITGVAILVALIALGLGLLGREKPAEEEERA